jgi:hypothetical protein
MASYKQNEARSYKRSVTGNWTQHASAASLFFFESKHLNFTKSTFYKNIKPYAVNRKKIP